MMLRLSAAILLLAAAAHPIALEAQSLKGSSASLTRQNQVAKQHDFTYLQTAAGVRSFAANGHLVRLSGNADYRLHAVSFPYARPAVRTFVERLSNQYRSACGERLVVTSLTRPASRQPANASDRSVHPTGMALDLRISERQSCRRWIESTLLALEKRGLIEATRERRPPHYHVVVFPRPYERYVSGVSEPVRLASSRDLEISEAEEQLVEDSREATYQVNRGDSLWLIAQRHGTTIQDLKRENGLRSSRLLPGQVLKIPGSMTVATR